MDDDFFEIPEPSEEDKKQMKEERENRLSFWSASAADGLLLSVVSIAILALGYFVKLPGAVSLILNLVKIVGSIWLLSRFMAAYSRSVGKVTYGRSFAFGLVVCLFSSLLCAAFNFLVTGFLKPDMLTDSFRQALQMYAQAGIPQAQISAFEDAMPKMPQYLAVFYFFWYLFIGLVASLCIAGSTKTSDGSQAPDSFDEDDE